ncbi:MAG: hypothetical protein UV74_C0001G0090 [Candidatus Woesebacteria bacterium GW2011_GWB1_43_14]|uniref:Uncharacterized protein n=1 Tax=Candidatus Woesebacteria bacterium GW2011_GWB1_43_14 TaxID=1618578 RepID=A0A0G1DM66_9BACT|nr:MAG: hypothetical protein UV51_C0002G0079 [Candidatus Woesebacteria bacterium GW2011_GWC1_42_9]KKS98980.1 MAG: hypothetical protein UV74_C0001G0090 [Candidatus Woesebacteria bacterium GW2011_GWB1_43_14]
MNKLFFLFMVGALLFCNPKTAIAQTGGVYFCVWGGGQAGCTLDSNQCSINYQPGDCSQFNNNPTACGDNNLSGGNYCVPGTGGTPPPGSNCSPGACTTSSDCGGGSCSGTNPENLCSGTCSCPQTSCNSPLDCQGLLAACQNITAGEWCSGTCYFSEEDPPPSEDTSDFWQDISEGCADPNSINTAIGCLPLSTEGTAGRLLAWGAGILGGVAFLVIFMGGFRILSSQGDPRKVMAGRELIIAAVSGLTVAIFSIFILRLLGVNILQIL